LGERVNTLTKFQGIRQKQPLKPLILLSFIVNNYPQPDVDLIAAAIDFNWTINK